MEESNNGRSRKAEWCKKYFKLQDIVGSNYYFCRPDRQFGKFRTGFGFIRVRIRGQEQLNVFYRAAVAAEQRLR